jgi:predicted dehydrogenase
VGGDGANPEGRAIAMMVRVGVIGAGHWGPHLIRNFDNKRRSIVAWVADRDARRLNEVRSRFPDVQVTSEADDVIGDDGVDAVVIATPTSTHFPLARAALERGKHVLVEKPITTSSSEGEALVEVARKAGRVLMVGHVFVYNAGVRAVKDHIDAGTLGRVYYISMVRTNLGPIRMDVNAAWDLAAHDISIVNHWLQGEPVAVSAVGGTWINPGLEDAVFATMRYPNDVLVNLHVSWLNPRKARDITVVGETHMLTLDDMNLNEPLRIYDKGVLDETVTPTFTDTFASFRASVREGDITIPKVSLGEPLRSECEHFIDCIMDGTTPITGGPEGVAVVRALEAITRSVKDGGAEASVR